MPTPTPMPIFAPVDKCVSSDSPSSAHGRPRAKTWLTTTFMVGVVVVEAVAMDAAMTELIDARTEEYKVVVKVLTQGRLPMILCPY